MARAEPPPADGRPYPNLGSVPPNPRRVQQTATQAEIGALDAERRASLEAAAKLEAARIPDAPPAPVQLAPVALRGARAAPAAVPAPAAVALSPGPLSVAFPPGSSRMSNEQLDQVRRNAAAFSGQNARVRVVGVWTRAADRALALARARAVAGEIIRQGVPASRVDVRDGVAQGGGGDQGNRVEILVDY